MNVKESLQIVNLLHSAFPQDRKATQADLFTRANTYSVALAKESYEDVRKAAEHIIQTSNWYPTTKELIKAVETVRRMEAPAMVTNIPKAEPIPEEDLNEYLDAFCEWIGFGCEEDSTALDRYYDKHPEMIEKMRRIFNNE